MKIITGELYKLINSRVFLFTFAISLLLVLYSSVIYKPENAECEQYRAFYSDISAKGKKTEYIEERLNEELSSREPTIEWIQRVSFYREQLNQAEAIENYKAYLENIEKAAQKITSVSIFADKNSYTYKNAVLTPRAYKAVSDVVPVFSPSEGVTFTVDNRVVDIALLFTVICAAMVLVGKERESGIISLIKPLKKGRYSLCGAKLAALFLATAVTSALLLGVCLISAEIKLGLGDLTRPVQSVSGYIGCNLPVSVAEFIAAVYVIKILAVFTVGVVFVCLCTRLSVTTSAVVLTAFSAAELALYILIDFTSVFSPLAAINFAAFIDSDNIFKSYNCINAFNMPIDYLVAVIIRLTVAIILSVLVAIFLFGRINIFSVGKRYFSLPFSNYIPKTPFGFSLYKTMITHKGFVITALAIAIVIYGAADLKPAYTVDEAYYKSYCEKFSAMSMDKADEFITAEESRYNELQNKLSSPDISIDERIRIASELNGINGFYRAKEQYEYINRLEIENKAMFYESGYNRIFGIDGYKEDMTLALVIISVLCLSVLPYVAYDRKCRMEFLINATKKGKAVYYKHIFVIAVLLSAVITLSVNLVYFLAVLNAYGTNGMQYSLRCLSEFEGFADIPIWCGLVLLCAFRILISALFSCTLVLISSVTNGISNAILIGAVAFILPVLIYLAGYDFALNLCVPLSISRLWLDFDLYSAINAGVFVGAGVVSLYIRICRKEAILKKT